MSVAEGVRYDVVVMARLCHPEDDAEAGEQRASFIKEAVESYELEVARRQLEAEKSEDFSAPQVVLQELRRVAGALEGLRAYRDRLVTFAQLWASETASTRQVAAAAGVSHTTVLRTGELDLVAEVAGEAMEVAREVLSTLDAGRDPGLYGRLTAVTAAAPTAQQMAALQAAGHRPAWMGAVVVPDR